MINVLTLVTAIPALKDNNEPITNLANDVMPLDDDLTRKYTIICDSGASLIMDEKTLRKSSLVAILLQIDSESQEIAIPINECNQKDLEMVI